MKTTKFRIFVAAAIALLILGGCTQLPRSESDSGIAPKPAPLSAPDPANVIGMDDADVVQTIPTTDDVQPFYVASPLDESDPLPDIRLTGISFSTQSIYEAMRQILAGTPLSFSINYANPNSAVQRRNVVAEKVSGSLSAILDSLSNTLGIYYTYKDGVINITPDRQYIVSIPPIEDAMDSVVGMIQRLGGQSVHLDKPSRVVTFRASRPDYQQINAYLAHIRKNRVMLVLEATVWEVGLNDAKSTGIQWNKLTANNGQGVATANAATATSGSIPAPDVVQGINLSGGQSSSLPGSVGLAMVYNTSRFALDALASFLKTQGTLVTLSQPKWSLLTGTKPTTLKTGTETPYVASIATTVVNNSVVNSTTYSKFTSGLEMSVSGDYSDGTVYSTLKLKLTDFIQWVETPSNGQVTRQPQLANRELEIPAIRLRPGHTVMLAGINIQRAASTDSGLPLGGDSVVPTYSDRNKTRSELVIVLRVSRMIRFDPPAVGGKGAPNA